VERVDPFYSHQPCIGDLCHHYGLSDDALAVAEYGDEIADVEQDAF